MVLAIGGRSASAAQPQQRSFDIPPSGLTNAMVDFALQAGVTVGTVDAAHCSGQSPGARGRMGLTEALDRMLAGTGCTYRQVRADAYQIVREATRKPPEAILQDAAASSSPVSEIVLTAPKLSGLSSQSPNAITVISGQELEAERVRDVGDLALDVSGLSVTNQGAGQDKVIIRGLSDGAFTGRTASTVGIYLDDARVTFDAPDPDLLLTDIDHITVLRGPQGTLYGSGSVGGIYQVSTRQPVLDRMEAFLEGSAASTRSGAPSGDVQAMLNLPLVDGRLALRLVGYDEIAGGYLDNPRLGLKNTNRVNRSGGRGKLELRLNDRWSVTLAAAAQQIASADAQYADGTGGAYVRQPAIEEPYDNDFSFLGLEVDGSGSWGRLHSATSIVGQSLSGRYDPSDALLQFGSTAAAGAFDDVSHRHTIEEELSLASPPDQRLAWIGGLFLARTQESGVSTLNAPVGAVPQYLEDRHDSLVETALYGQLTYRLTAQLSATAGVRLFHFGRSTTSIVSFEAASSFAGSTRGEGVAPKLALEFAPLASATLYAQMAEGYRPAGFSTGGLPSDAATSGGLFRRYGSDEVWSYEAGAKATLVSGRLQLRLAGYEMTWRNVQSDQILPSGLPYTINIGDAYDRGLEAEGVFQPFKRLTLRGNISASEAELDRPSAAFAALRAEAPLPAAPGLTLGGSAEYAQPLSGLLTLVLRAAAQHQGVSNITFVSRIFDEMGDFTTTRLSAALRAARWSATLYVDNPLNDSGDTFGFGNPFSLEGTRQTTPQRPLTVGLSLVARY